jgi:hypothetical protein
MAVPIKLFANLLFTLGAFIAISALAKINKLKRYRSTGKFKS